jgi:hypothetical protein
MSFQPGDRVLIEASVVQVYHPDREPAYQSLGLQLAGDGQHVLTNVSNVRLAPVEASFAEEKAAEAAEDKALRPAANKALRPRTNKAAEVSHGE